MCYSQLFPSCHSIVLSAVVCQQQQELLRVSAGTLVQVKVRVLTRLKRKRPASHRLFCSHSLTIYTTFTSNEFILLSLGTATSIVEMCFLPTKAFHFLIATRRHKTQKYTRVKRTRVFIHFCSAQIDLVNCKQKLLKLSKALLPNLFWQCGAGRRRHLERHMQNEEILERLETEQTIGKSASKTDSNAANRCHRQRVSFASRSPTHHHQPCSVEQCSVGTVHLQSGGARVLRLARQCSAPQ